MKNSRLESYKNNLQILTSIIGLKIISAIEEQYFFEGKLDGESRGALKLEFSTGKEIIFNCDQDAESIKIENGGFSVNGSLETNLADARYKWKEKEYLSSDQLDSLGFIQSTEIETLNLQNKVITQSGCRLNFQNGDFLHIWTIESDNIFYGINQEPSYYHKNKEFKIELRKLPNNLSP